MGNKLRRLRDSLIPVANPSEHERTVESYPSLDSSDGQKTDSVVQPVVSVVDGESSVSSTLKDTEFALNEEKKPAPGELDDYPESSQVRKTRRPKKKK